MTRSFDVFFDLRPNKRLSKQLWGWWFETPSYPLWRHCNEFEAYNCRQQATKYFQNPLRYYVNISLLVEMQNWIDSSHIHSSNNFLPRSFRGGTYTFFCFRFNVNEYHPALSQNNHKKRQMNHLFILMNILTMHLTHWGRDKMAAIFQTTIWNAFSWMKMYAFRLSFHWSLFPRDQLTIFQHWLR